MTNARTKGILLVTGTAAMWGAVASFARMITDRGLSQITLMGIRAPLVALVLFVFLYLRHGRGAISVSRRTLAIYAVLGLLTIVLNSTGYMQSCVLLTLPQAVILHYTFPLVTMLGDIFITKERPTLIHFASGVLILIGLYVGFASGGEFGSVDIMGVFWGLLSVFGFSAQTIMTRTMMRGGSSDPIVQLFYTNLFGGAMMVAGITATVGWADVSAIDAEVAALMTYPIFVNGLIGFVFLYAALKYIPATLASLVCSLEVVSTLVTMPLILGVAPTMREVIGSAIVLVAVALSAVKRERRETAYKT